MNVLSLLTLALTLLLAVACAGESPTPAQDLGATVEAAVAAPCPQRRLPQRRTLTLPSRPAWPPPSPPCRLHSNSYAYANTLTDSYADTDAYPTPSPTPTPTPKPTPTLTPSPTRRQLLDLPQRRLQTHAYQRPGVVAERDGQAGQTRRGSDSDRFGVRLRCHFRYPGPERIRCDQSSRR